MIRLLIRIVLVVSACLAGVAWCQAPRENPPVARELLQYIRDARRAGIDEQQIRQDALSAGWPANLVSAALESAGRDPAAGPEVPVTGGVKPNEPNPAAKAEGAPAKMETTPAALPGSAPEKPDERTKAPPVVDRGVPDDYQIGAGDELQISVWKEPDASVGGVVVRPDGKISMPILKEVSVIGLTPIQAETMITERLVKFIAAADVTIIVRAINSKKIYVVGGVKKEGPIPYTYRMTVLQAISEAGGLSDYAKRKKIYILRHENGRSFQLPFNYEAALRGEKMELNVPMQPGDTLVVPK
jgi:polysaccharide export outer membrane protein